MILVTLQIAGPLRPYRFMPANMLKTGENGPEQSAHAQHKSYIQETHSSFISILDVRWILKISSDPLQIGLAAGFDW